MNNQKPLISVIIAVLNNKETLQQCLDSVIQQTYPNVELIVIDGGSTDGTVDIIANLSQHIAYWVSEPDSGIYDAMNKGIAHSSGCWLIFIGADDRLFDADVISSIPFIEYTDYALIAGKVIYGNGIEVRSFLGYGTLLHNTVHHQSAFYNKKLFVNWKYDTKFHISADYDLNLMLLLANAKTIMIDKIISFCRDGGVSRVNIKSAYIETNEVRRKNLRKNFAIMIFLYFIKLKLSIIKNFVVHVFK